MFRFLNGILVLLCVASCAPRHFVEKQAQGLTLSLDIPCATEVLFASSTDSFRLHSTVKNNNGLWETTVRADREFHYFYIVDGREYIPDCRYREDDDFGANTCIYQP